MRPDSPCRGRFAPSPTGPLHFGSLVAAVGSFLDARARGGQWLVRIEDLDPPREVPGAAREILHTLEALGLEWDGPVLHQSTRAAVYKEALQRLRDLGRLYPCACSRREIADQFPDGAGAGIYPGTCRNGIPAGRTPRSLRLRVDDDAVIRFRDRLYGERSQKPGAEVGDFVLRRTDGLAAYQLAVVVDDAAQGITDVVRGADLLDSTPLQIVLQHLLGLPTPRYLHLPVARGPDGSKLSKQTGALPVDAGAGVSVLLHALAFLGQPAPPELRQATPAELWSWAVPRWDPARLPRAQGLPAPTVADAGPAR